MVVVYIIESSVTVILNIRVLSVFCLRMMGKQYIFQMSGIKNPSVKRVLLEGIRQLGGVYTGGSVYSEATTHLIVHRALASEKLLAACAGGKWIVTPEFVLDSLKHMSWLPEASYEINMTSQIPGLPNPLITWRESVSNGAVSGAFQDWVVFVDINDPKRRDMFVRILKSGKAVVSTEWPASKAVTHLIAKDKSKDKAFKHGIPYYNVSCIAKQLFGSVDGERETATQDATVTNKSMDVTDNFSHKELEEMLKAYIIKMEERKKMLLMVPEVYSFYTSSLPVQIPAVDFSNVQSLVECALYPQALEEILGSLQPGVVPPAPLLHQLMQHALHGNAKPHFLSTFIAVLHSILRNNPTWGHHRSVKYFLQVLQCPDCKCGLWSFLKTSVGVFVGSEPTCHSLPSPPSTELFRLHCNLQEFFLRLFQLELNAASLGRSSGRSNNSVLYCTFWNRWEKLILTSRAVQELCNLLIKTLLWSLNSTEERKEEMLITLQQTLCVVVEYWAQEHRPLNSRLVEKGFKDLAEHIAILCQDLHCDALKKVIPALRSPRLQMFTADAIYTNICRSRGLIISSEPLSLLKIVSTYTKALGQLCNHGSLQTLKPQTDKTNQLSANSVTPVSPGLEVLKDSAGGSGLGKESVPKGYRRVNAAGETLLHRASKRNQVKTLLHILSLPGTDVNVKDHAGWTPLHEACNHGSTECVQALLQYCPKLQMDSQVHGVSPLHDALLNQHTDIAKMLLRHAGLSLLNLRDNEGRTPLDLISSATVREELYRCAEEGAKALFAPCLEVQDLPFIEACSWVLLCLLLAYLQEQNVPFHKTSLIPLDLSPTVCHTLVHIEPSVIATTWRDLHVVTIAEDLKTLMNMEQYVSQISPALRHCQGVQTSLFIQLLQDLHAEGSALLTSESELTKQRI